MQIDNNGLTDIKGKLKLSGATSGYVAFAPAAAAGSTTYTLPSIPGTSGQVLTTDGAAGTATLSWETVSGGGGGTTLTNSASLATALSDETGTGLAVFSAAPTFTGIPLAPTAAVDTNTNQLATTAFVLAQAGAASPLMNNTVAVGTSTRFARQDHIHPVDTSRSPVAGSTSVTTLGTITAGVWNATTIALANGGTGATSASGARTNLGLVTGSSNTNIPVFGANAIAGSMCTYDLTLGFICTQAIPSGGSVANTIPVYQARVATNAQITLSGTKTIDGVAVVVGNRVLVKNQNSYQQNGVYAVATGAWTRVADMDSWAETIGYKVQVLEGDSSAKMIFSSETGVGGTLDSSWIQWNSLGMSYNTVLGMNALAMNINGSSNTAIGNEALAENTTGNHNHGIGMRALSSNKTGLGNVALGSYALYRSVGGNYNIAIGDQALTYNTEGISNVSVGPDSLLNNTIGDKNVALGPRTLTYNVSGSYNVAIGDSSQDASTGGDYKIGIGYNSLYQATGLKNIGIGYRAGASITTGAENIIIGGNNGSTIATSSNNIILADGAGSIRMQIDNLGNTGIGAPPNASYKLEVTGSINATGLVRAAGTTLTSDKRLKKDIKIIPDALEKILNLNGVTYNWNHSFHPELNLGDRPQMGVIAQQIEKVFPQAVSTDTKGIKSVAYNMLIAPIIESIKALHSKWFADSKKLHREVAMLKEENKMLKNYLCKKDKKADFCHR